MLNIGDRVLQTTTTQGTGTINLDGTVTGFRSFVAGIGNGKKTVYLISDNTNWEVGIGTVTDANPDTLSRTTILSSSNSGAAVNWGPGTRNVYCTMAAPVLPIADENLNFMYLFGTGGGTANAHSVTMPVAPLALSADMQFFYRPTIANTTAGFTISVNGLSAKAAKVNGADPGIGFAGIGDLLFCVYKASNNTIEILNLSKISEMAYQTRNLNIALNENLVTVASAATPDIWGVNGNVINYTGTTTTTGFTNAPQAGARRTLICAGAVQFTNSANLIVPGGANYISSAGDRVHVIAVTTTQFRLEISKANGTAVVAPVVNPLGTLLGTFTASNQATLNLTGVLTPTYKKYLLDIKNLIPLTNNVTLQGKISTDNGSSWIAGAGYYSSLGRLAPGGLGAGGGGAAALFTIATVLSNTLGGLSARLLVNIEAAEINYNLVGTMIENGGTPNTLVASGRNATALVNALQFYMSSGNISGVIDVYGQV